ncbi:unnamed protein product [Symbiodinium natans]|uniref:Uncharacterized protein n=1 Tax=Symbiodinium natans TaxID=878477 RepID=A0A812IDN5_9DINO|nr:unnamed protein product [Symbiodinium natans]
MLRADEWQIYDDQLLLGAEVSDGDFSALESLEAERAAAVRGYWYPRNSQEGDLSSWMEGSGVAVSLRYKRSRGPLVSISVFHFRTGKRPSPNEKKQSCSRHGVGMWFLQLCCFHAIALSLSIEEERLRQIAANEDHNIAETAPPVPPVPPPPPGAGFTSAPLCHLPPKPQATGPRGPSGPSARLVQTEPMKLPRKPWGFTSAPLLARPPPSAAVAPPSTPSTPSTPSVPSSDPAPAAIPRLPGRAGFTSSPLCTVPPKPRVAVGAPTDASPPPPPPPPPAEGAEEGAADAAISSSLPSLPPVQTFRTNLQMWKRRASEAVQPLPKQLREARSRMLSPPSSPKSAAGDFSVPSEEERQQRADHLRRQRDRLIEMRSKDRERQLSELGCAGSADAHHGDMEAWAALGRRRVAELSGARLADETAPSSAQPESAEKLRQALTRQLLQSLAQSMVSDADAYMDLAIGNKAWHTEVPTLMEGGMDGLTGIERGRMLDARTSFDSATFLSRCFHCCCLGRSDVSRANLGYVPRWKQVWALHPPEDRGSLL